MNKKPKMVVEVAAGGFSAWLRATREALQKGGAGADVPCGECNACCRASMFIHIRPHETQSLKHIPKALLFPVPGLPKGNVLMGYNDKGQCPMLVQSKCSIYKHRPQTCRDYDCRIFAATDIQVDQRVQAGVAERISAWRFEFPAEQDKQEYQAVKKAADFLQKKKNIFPPDFLPGNPVQLALLALKIYPVFQAASPEVQTADNEIARLIIGTLEKFEAQSRPR